MKKHAAGVLFFVLVVSFSAIGYALFQTYPMPQIDAVEIPERPTAVYQGRRMKVIQAIASVSDNCLMLELEDIRAEDSQAKPEAATINLAYHNVTSAGARFSGGSVIEIGPSEWVNGRVRKAITYKYPRFRAGSENLYVTACIVGAECGVHDVPPFAEQNSAPVLIAAEN